MLKPLTLLLPPSSLLLSLFLLLLSLSLLPPTSAEATPISPLLPHHDFADPCIIYSPQNSTYYAFATSSFPSGKNIQVASSPSSPSGPWTYLSSADPLPDTGPWTSGAPSSLGQTWAPSVVSLPDDGGYVMYYSAQLPANSSAFHCVGAAVSNSSVLGPYVPLPSPLACPLSRGGAIDPSGFLDPRTGDRYLLYKIDGNSLGGGGSCGNAVAPQRPTPIVLQRVDPSDGVTLVGDPVEILDRDERDGPLVEAPDMWFHEPSGSYVLFYSNHCWSERGYSVNYAVSASGNITGPYTKMNGTMGLRDGERALIRSFTGKAGDTGFNVTAPGGATSYVLDAKTGESGIVFHANCPEGRCLFGAGIGMRDDGVVYVY